jgi:hypothetical protein
MWRWAVAAGTLAAAPAAAQQVTAEQAMENFRNRMEAPARRCAEAGEAEDVVVCGRRQEDNRYRAPLYAAPDDGPATRAGGEQRAAMEVGSSPCTPVGRAQRCGGGLPVFAIAGYLARALIAIATPDD